MKKTIGILAHVDAGKTTFSEQILFHARAIRAPGRVDSGSAFLDAHPLERQRGITIFSDQAFFSIEGDEYFWLDTPGHADLSAEMERAASVMDYAVLLINGAEGVQSHTEAVWTLLKERQIPVFLFVNKIDRPGVEPEAVLAQLKRRLSPDVVDMRPYGEEALCPAILEAVAERDEALLEMFLSGREDEALFQKALVRQIAARALFPAFFGSALNDRGVKEFLLALHRLTRTRWDSSGPFQARVYKVRRDSEGARLCFFKVLSGAIAAREEARLADGNPVKINELKRFHGAKSQSVSRAEAGDLVAATGLKGPRPGDLLGEGARAGESWRFAPMMAVSVLRPSVSPEKLLAALRELEEEEPTLCVAHNKKTGAIDLHAMGPIQLEVLGELLRERHGIEAEFGPMRVLYQETIARPVVGVGHYEPLRHYAEVHLRLVPLPRGSGIQFVSRCHVDDLALNWQRLIETHVREKAHKGVLTGAPLTDCRVELLKGRAHLKHTEGGDFRESTYRAIRNALMRAESVLLEPICRFSLSAPAECYGRVMGDLSRIRAETEPPLMDGERFSLKGEAAFREFSSYIAEFPAATRGRGTLRYRPHCYAPCRDWESVVSEAGYNPLSDDTPDSVFCSHGAGFVVPWNEVANFAHLPVDSDEPSPTPPGKPEK